jgi:2-amino-4-hydroxy-6-hydroxymethyldihydropteridine diphosphokinase
MAPGGGRVFLALGANLGDRETNLRQALELLSERCTVTAVSSLYRSDAVVPEGEPPGPEYLNAVVEVTTQLTPVELLRFVKEVERRIGRTQAKRWAPRLIDIDIVLYGGEMIDTPGLTVPHPRMADRAFVLAPLAELAPEVVHPQLGSTVEELAAGIGRDGLERVRASEWASDALRKAGRPAER